MRTGFNPHPGWLPGETVDPMLKWDGQAVSIRTRVGYRVRQVVKWVEGHEMSFNPHPGWLPGETTPMSRWRFRLSCFNPHPGWLPGETIVGVDPATASVVSIRTRVGYRVRRGRLTSQALAIEFQSAPGLVTG